MNAYTIHEFADTRQRELIASADNARRGREARAAHAAVIRTTVVSLRWVRQLAAAFGALATRRVHHGHASA